MGARPTVIVALEEIGAFVSLAYPIKFVFFCWSVCCLGSVVCSTLGTLLIFDSVKNLEV